MDIREEINANSPAHHALSREILGLDWYDVEGQARRVIDRMVESAAQNKDEVTPALLSVMDERHRQIHEEGHTTENDDRYAGSYQLSRAAACYAIPPGHRWRSLPLEGMLSRCGAGHLWPWDSSFFKGEPDGELTADTEGRRRELVKAGALILAAIEVIDRSNNNEQR